MTSTELEDLEQLVSLPGWRRFVDAVSPNSDRVVAKLFANRLSESFHTLAHYELSDVRSRREVIAWPVERIKYLRRIIEEQG